MNYKYKQLALSFCLIVSLTTMLPQVAFPARWYLTTDVSPECYTGFIQSTEGQPLILEGHVGYIKITEGAEVHLKKDDLEEKLLPPVESSERSFEKHRFLINQVYIKEPFEKVIDGHEAYVNLTFVARNGELANSYNISESLQRSTKSQGKKKKRVSFTFKPDQICELTRWSLPASYSWCLPEEEKGSLSIFPDHISQKRFSCSAGCQPSLCSEAITIEYHPPSQEGSEKPLVKHIWLITQERSTENLTDDGYCLLSAQAEAREEELKASSPVGKIKKRRKKVKLPSSKKSDEQYDLEIQANKEELRKKQLAISKKFQKKPGLRPADIDELYKRAESDLVKIEKILHLEEIDKYPTKEFEILFGIITTILEKTKLTNEKENLRLLILFSQA